MGFLKTCTPLHGVCCRRKEDMGEKMRIDKLLSNMGRGSRTEVKEAIKYGWVKVNGKTIKSAKDKVDVELDEILYQGQPIQYQAFTYLMLHKPDGVISATEDTRHKTVIDLLEPPFNKMGLFPVGRLDIDTEGLLLLTNDGELSHKLLSPKKHVCKKYYARIDGIVDESDIEAFKNRITLDDGYQCLPSELSILSIKGAFSEIEVVIYEGKFHQVKRMFEAVGKSVVYLKRMEMGSLKLDALLPLGSYRPLTEEELLLLKGKDSNNSL